MEELKVNQNYWKREEKNLLIYLKSFVKEVLDISFFLRIKGCI